MAEADQVVAQSDALERLAYAGVLGDRSAAADALGELEALGSGAASPPSQETIEAAVQADPIVAAALGWLTFQELSDIVAADPSQYLSDTEQNVYAEMGNAGLRFVVRSRMLGEPLDTDDLINAQRSDFTLAARGRSSDWQKVRALLVDQGLVDEEESPLQ